MLLASIWIAVGAAHPMGNFSVNHYARLEPGARGVTIHHVMDLAEIPTFELFQQWGPGADPRKKAVEQARLWAGNLKMSVNGKPVSARVLGAQIVLAEGAGNMQVARITAEMRVDSGAGAFTYEDRNYEGRSGWKEIVGPGDKDRSAGLTAYPQDPMVAPPQELTAAFRWSAPVAAPVATPAVTDAASSAAESVGSAPAAARLRRRPAVRWSRGITFPACCIARRSAGNSR